MASGSQNMTTYNARIVTGSNNAASPAGALLLSGAGRADNATGDTWIFLDSLGGLTNPWGIKHDQANNKLQIFGSGTNSVSVRMNTGDTYILGKVGIGYDPETSGNTYKLYVNGSSYFTDYIYIGRNDSAHIYLINKNWTKGTNPSSQTYSAIEYNDTDNSRVALLEATLDTSGNSRFNIYLVPNVASSTSWSGIVLQKTNADVLTVNIAGATTVSGTVHANGGYLKSTANGNTVTIGSQNTGFAHIQSSANIPFYFNRTTLIDGDLGNTSYPVKNITIGKANGAGIYYQGSKANYRMIRFIDNATDTYGNGISIGGGGQTIIGGGESADAAAAQVGTAGSEIMYVCNDGEVNIFTNMQDGWASRKTFTFNADGLYSHSWFRTYGNSGWYSQSYGGGWYMADAKWIRSYGSKPVLIDIGSNNTYGLCGHRLALGLAGASHISLMMKGGDIMYGFCVNGNGNWYFGKRTSKSFESTSGDAYNYYGSNTFISPVSDNAVRLGGSSNRWSAIYGVKVYNAVWNDYAECRHSNELEPGRCVTETSSINGMIRTTERLLPGCKLVSDTYGTLMGETDKAKTPIAVSGRVLAYPYRDKKEYSLGAAVCSAPNGTVDIMTREEIMKYPERIVGTVSEIPTYEIWSGGAQNGKDDIQVNGRIWIYVR